MTSAKIIVVEDEVLVGLDIKNTLEDLGYDVVSVFAEAGQLLNYLQDRTPDLILMDIHLKGDMDGIDAAREVYDRYGIPVLFLTAFANTEVICRAREVGAYGYLLKPFKNQELEAMVEVALFKHTADQKRKLFDKQVQQAQKYESLQIMAGGVAHKFNNALHAVLGNISLALDDIPSELPARYNLIEAEKAAWKAANLSKQMLACSGNGLLEPAEMDISVLIDLQRHILEALLPSSVVLNVDLGTGLPRIMADPAQLKQIIIALIANAIEAIDGKSGVITIRTSVMECDKDYLASISLNEFIEEGIFVFLEVIDTGCGMDGDTILKVFDPFFSTKFEGRGLGLAAVLGIAKAHGGVVKITSEPGKGTSVKILLPVPQTSQEEYYRKTDEISNLSGHGIVLIVDDEESVRVLGRIMLERNGFTVITAADGIEAVDIFRKHSAEIVCVLLDLTMPRKDGIETLSDLRGIRPDAKIILSSGYDEKEACQRISDDGLAGFIQKPYKLSTLIDKIRDAGCLMPDNQNKEQNNLNIKPSND